MKKIPILIALAMSAMTVMAKETALRIMLNNGSQEFYSLQDKPVVTFTDDNLCITSGTVSSSYPRGDIQSINFIDKTTKLSAPSVAGTVRDLYDGETFSCPGHDIMVYNLGGINIASGHDSVALGHLNRGIYIVKANHQTLKIVKK